jgi:uncharacterized membrane protein
MAPGETRAISTGTSVVITYTTPTGQRVSTTISLAPVTVAAEHIISLTPPTETAGRDAEATYTVQLTNPDPTDQTYNLSTEGLDGFTVGLASSILVPAGQTVTTPLDVTVPVGAAPSTTGFRVIATTAGGAEDSVEGALTVSSHIALQTRAVYLAITPTQATAGQGTAARYQLTVTNVGSVADTDSLSVSGLPQGITAALGQTTIDGPPGVSNFRDVPLKLTVAPATAPGRYPFTVTAASTSDPSLTSTASGALTVTAGGVQVTLNPPSGAPGSTLQATVTNTGTTRDTFNLALGGPAALVASLGMNQVTLDAGASQVVPISTGAVNFAVPGTLNLTAAATSTSNSSIQDAGQADLNIPTTQGVTAAFSPATQTLPSPGRTTFLLLVHNTGNTEDSYGATILGSNGPITATLVGLDGSPTQSVPIFRVPGLSTGAILLQADLSAVGQGTVTVQVKSLTTGQVAAPTAIATVTPTAVTPTPTPAATPMLSVTPTRGPRVTRVKRFGFHAMPTTLVLTFDQALEPATAEDVHNYRIVSHDGHHVKIDRAVYNPANRTVILHLDQRLSIHHPYWLTVVGTGSQGISTPQHQLLDSQEAGQPGGDYRLKLTWRQLVLGRVSRKFLTRYHILPKSPQPSHPSSGAPPKAHASHTVVHSSGLFNRSVPFPAHHAIRPSRNQTTGPAASRRRIGHG